MLSNVRVPLLVVWMVGVGGNSRFCPVSWFDELARILTKVAGSLVFGPMVYLMLTLL